MNDGFLASNGLSIDSEIERVLITESQLKDGVQKLASRLVADYEERDLTIIGILTGSLIFLADLIRLLPMSIRLDTVSVSLYGDSTSPHADGIKIFKDLSLNIADKDVLVVDDIVDTGSTMAKIMEGVRAHNPRSLKSCALLNKRGRRQKDLEPDYWCFEIDNYFVVGYGLDYSDKYRNLPFVAVLKTDYRTQITEDRNNECGLHIQ